jgi:ribonuclease R
MMTESLLLRQIERQPRHTAGYKQLLRELGVRGSERRQLSTMLDELVRQGKLVLVDRDRFALPDAASSRNLIVGKLTTHRDGYGFVSANDRETRERLGGGIFIPPTELGEAMHGDTVLAELRRGSEQRPEGRVIRVMERAQPTVVGTFHYGARNNYVQPIDERVTMPIVIPQGCELLAESEELPLPQHSDRVIGEEARRRQWDDLEGVVVDVAITDWPTRTEHPRGRVVEVLGYEDDFGIDVEIMIRKHHLPHHFPLSVVEEAKAAPRRLAATELRRRVDFRQLPIVTIDGETARDFDDAVFVRKLANGNFELQVHIADVSHYVAEGSAIDIEAELRGTSVYFPDRSVPMLPLELSTDLCSLRPERDRLVMSVRMEIDAAGEIVGVRLCNGVIRSAARMTYTQVAAVLEGDAAMRKKFAGLTPVFETMEELAQLLNRKRARRGSIDFDLPEPVITFDKDGLMQGVTRSERNQAHRLIEEFMLAANESVASYLEGKSVALLSRVHEPPEAKRVYEFENLAAAFGYSLGVGALPVSRFQLKPQQRHEPRRGHGQQGREERRSRQTIELPREVEITPRMYQKLAAKIEGKPEERILSYLMLRSLRQARYSEESLGHFALAASSYAHFTSPIRRYPDLIVHRILKDVLAESAETEERGVPVGLCGHVAQGYLQEPAGHATPWRHDAPHAASRQKKLPAEPAGPFPLDELRRLAEECSFAERRAEAAERELVEWKKVKFMEDKVGADYKGLITSVTKFGLFIELEELFVAGLIPLASLQDDYYVFHENTRQLIGRRTRRTFSLGQRVEVLVDRIDPVEKKIQFALFEEEPVRRPKKGKAKAKRRGRR